MALFSHHTLKPVADGGTDLGPLLAAASLPAGSGITLGADVLSCNLHLLPARSFAAVGLYVTQAGGGSGYIAATDAQLTAYPDAVKIAQLPAGDPYWADELDYEAGAATIPELVTWARGALQSFEQGTRPGQRSPLVYCSASNVHVVANALVDGGIKSGIGLHLANWGLTEPQAAADVIARSGPFPIAAVQYADPGDWDLDLWATAWLTSRSGKPKPAGYDAPKNLKAAAGHDSVRLTWSPPGTPGLPEPAGYDLYLYASAACTRSSLVPTWGPRRPGPVTEYQGGSLERGRTYYARAVATGPGGTLVRPGTFAQTRFTTG